MYLFVYKLKLQKYPISFLFIFKKVSLNNNKIIKVVVISNTTQVKKENVKLSISIQIKIQKEWRIDELNRKINVNLINLNVTVPRVSLELCILNCVSHSPYSRGFLSSCLFLVLSVLWYKRHYSLFESLSHTGAQHGICFNSVLSYISHRSRLKFH